MEIDRQTRAALEVLRSLESKMAATLPGSMPSAPWPGGAPSAPTPLTPNAYMDPKEIQAFPLNLRKQFKELEPQLNTALGEASRALGRPVRCVADYLHIYHSVNHNNKNNLGL